GSTHERVMPCDDMPLSFSFSSACRYSLLFFLPRLSPIKAHRRHQFSLTTARLSVDPTRKRRRFLHLLFSVRDVTVQESSFHISPVHFFTPLSTAVTATAFTRRRCRTEQKRPVASTVTHAITT